MAERSPPSPPARRAPFRRFPVVRRLPTGRTTGANPSIRATVHAFGRNGSADPLNAAWKGGPKPGRPPCQRHVSPVWVAFRILVPRSQRGVRGFSARSRRP